MCDEDNDAQRKLGERPVHDAADRPEDKRAAAGELAHGDRLSPAEELRTAVGAGRPVRRGRDEPAAHGDSWNEDRQVPADLLYELLVWPKGRMKPRAVVLVGLRITGRLNLEAAELQAPLIAHNCYFDEPVNLIAARASEIQVTACHLHGIAADGLETSGDLDLRRSTLGVVGLVGAHIGGTLSLDGAGLTCGSYPLDLADGTLRPPESPTDTLEGMALLADRLQVDQTVSCEEDFVAEGELRLLSAHIGGQLLFTGATLKQGLIADRLQVDQTMSCGEDFVAEGELRLLSAHIGGQLLFTGATLKQGLIADHLRVDQTMFCGEGFVAEGELRLPGAHIDGQLSFDKAKLTNADRALDLEGARVDGEAVLRFASRPTGGLDLTGARLGRLFDSERTWPMLLRLRGCIYADVEATEDAQRRHEAKADGEARHPMSRWRLRLGAPPDVRRRLRWIQLAEEGQLPETSRLRRVRQRALRLSQRVAATARRLLRRPPHRIAARTNYAPQPYTQLMAFYRQEGRDGDARRVAYDRERRRRGQLGFLGSAWNLFLQWTVGYGYRPLRLLLWLGGLVLVGSLLFSSFHSNGDLTAVKTNHPPFVASIYTFDRLIPVVSLGLRDAFAPTGAAQWWAFTYTLLGWVLTVAVVAGLNTAVRRD
jgi:hypothetical protein